MARHAGSESGPRHPRRGGRARAGCAPRAAAARSSSAAARSGAFSPARSASNPRGPDPRRRARQAPPRLPPPAGRKPAPGGLQRVPLRRALRRRGGHRHESRVDIERIRPRRSLSGLARRFFSAPEQGEIAAAPDPLLAFYRVWARKEAVIKADGRGVSIGLDRFDVSAGEPAALLHARWAGAAPGEAAHWSLRSLEIAPDYAAALAVRRADAAVVVRGTAATVPSNPGTPG